eukprot:CAMPEP_0178983228 /NCGR_PEP_ID=MMETSP0795-20121207/937_1 /TAXON_ID=88552 /ORGANISM="Amoebophrya sp., Strain Ameob2" /LENGTH=628 /DNA_ID=CAMNT_0020673965 /DNA_START=134 /DNA_END=2017 /DNA_ORIENTATION=-
MVVMELRLLKLNTLLTLLSNLISITIANTGDGDGTELATRRRTFLSLRPSAAQDDEAGSSEEELLRLRGLPRPSSSASTPSGSEEVPHISASGSFLQEQERKTANASPSTSSAPPSRRHLPHETPGEEDDASKCCYPGAAPGREGAPEVDESTSVASASRATATTGEEPHKSQPGRDHVDHVDEDPARGDEQEQVVLPRGKRDCSGKDKIWTVHYMPWAVPQCVDYDHWCQGTSWYKPKIDAVCKAEGEEVLLRNDADKNRLCQDSAAGGLEKGLAGLYRIPTKCGPCDGKKESCFIAGGGGKEGEEKLKGSTPYHIEAQMQLIYDSCIDFDAIWIDYQRTSWNGAVEFVISVLEKMKERGDVLRFAIVIDPNATRGQHWTQAHDPAQSPFTTRWVGHELYHTWKGKKLVPVFAVNLATAPVKMVANAIYFHDSQGRNYEALDTGGVHFAGTYPWPCGGNGGNLQYLRDRYRECREGKRTDMPCVGLLYPQFCDCYKDTSYCCHGYCEIPGKMTENCLFATASFLAGELKGEASGVDIVQIVTWNDYGEMTHIEPSTLRGLDEKLPGCAGGGLLPNVCLSQRKFPQGYKDWRGMVEGRLGQNKESNAAQTLLRVRKIIRNQQEKYTEW